MSGNSAEVVTENIPFQTINWREVPATEHAGESGVALWRTKQYEGLRIRYVEYSPGYVADHWCEKGHIVYCLKGEVINEEHWGLKKLAYPIQHKNTGFYHLLEFKSEPSLISKLETELRRDEKVMRCLTVSIDKHALVYNERI